MGNDSCDLNMDTPNNVDNTIIDDKAEFTLTINNINAHKKNEIVKALNELDFAQVDVLEVLHITTDPANLQIAINLLYEILEREDKKPDVLKVEPSTSLIQDNIQNHVDTLQQKVTKDNDSKELEIMNSLLADVKITDEEEVIHDTPLHLASRLGRIDLVKLILSEYSASPDALGSNFRTPLHLAAKNGHVDIVNLLIDYNASINSKEKDNWTPLHYASHNGHAAIVIILLNNNAEVDFPDKTYNCNPLHLAAINGHFEVVNLLLDKNAPVEAKSVGDNTALHFAAKNGHANIVKCLLNKNIDVNLKNADGWTALHYAVENGDAESVKELMAHGADIHIKNSNDEAPFILAYKNNHFEIVKILSDKIQA